MTSTKVLGLNGFGLEVPDLEVARRFYTAFGLASSDKGAALTLRCPGRSNDEIVAIKGPQKRLHHLSFCIEPESESAFADKIARAGLQVVEKSPLASLRNGLWFQDPWGTWINLSPGKPESVVPLALPEYNLGGRGGRVDVALWQELPKARAPMRIGHMLIFTPEWEKTEKFFIDVLGLRITDRSIGKASFMAAGEGIIDHHCFGLINGTHRGFQHASFQMATLDDLGYAALRMIEAGYKETFGPGRHAIASNLFQYVRDPWGSWVEYYADMDKISDSWVSRDWDNLPYIWGPEWSPEFWGKEMNGNFEPR